MEKYVYFFGGGKAEGNASMKDLLGGKGANLAEMTNLGIPVPPGFTISTKACVYYYQHGGKFPDGLLAQVYEGMRKIEEIMEKRFGDPKNPLLVSVRSGARVSMPGMMDTVLNLGLNDETVLGLGEKTGNMRFAYDSYRRFVQMYGDVVLGLKPETKDEIDPFEKILSDLKKKKGVVHDIELSEDDLKELVVLFKEEIKKRKGVEFPSDPKEQLICAIGAVFNSWNNERAIIYRKLNNIPDDWGTAVNVQAMVFGNMGSDSGTGVAFTRNPATGENIFFGEYLMNAQGEDVVAGIRTPKPLSKAQKRESSEISLEEEMPEIYSELLRVREILEKHYKDMQDIEFTIERKKLWILQTRTGKRTGFAAFRIAVDMVKEGLIDKKEAIKRIEPEQLTHLLQPIFDPDEKKKAIEEGRFLAKGLNAGPGACSGRVVFFAEDAEALGKKDDVVLVRIETSPEDIKGMSIAKGILTQRGGMTSHAALVARQMGKVCVAGCGDLEIDYKRRELKVKDKLIKEGEYISLDGTTGEVIAGKIPTRPSEIIQVILEGTLKPEDSPLYQRYADLMSWAKEIKRLGVRTNADRPAQAKVALAFGAEGIGLCRTEHMFFEGDRIWAMREMIIADDKEGRERALSKLLPMQREDFIGIFEVMGGLPVIIRTLDPPLHEFLPHTDEEIKELSERIGVDFLKVKAKVESLKEANPMLGHRGCRLGVFYPEITRMQAQAIFEAACEVKKKGIDVFPEVMIPLVSHVNELKMQKKIVDEVAKDVFKRYKTEVRYLVGTMIETPRAAITAFDVATVAQFFSFGTNDLTQMTFGLSRDDSAKFMPAYVRENIFPYNPFQRIDTDGVGKLMEIAVSEGKRAREDLEIGICGEHGGEPSSIKFCHRIGLDYVSCSPYRVPVAILSAAQAALLDEEGKD